MKFEFSYRNYSINLELLRHIRKKPHALTVFNYHQIGKKFIPGIHTQGTFTESSFFREQLVYIQKEYTIISLSEGIELLNHGKLDGNYAAITVDDGDKSVLEMIPILKKLQIPATFFINGAHLDNKMSYWYAIYNFIKHHSSYNTLITQQIEEDIVKLRHTLDREFYQEYVFRFQKLFEEIKTDFNLYLSSEELKVINDPLFNIAPHGYYHERFSMMDESWQRDNLEKDIVCFKDHPYYQHIFAIPFGRTGDWNHTTIKVALELGLQIVFANGGINVEKDVGYKRIPADRRVIEELKF